MSSQDCASPAIWIQQNTTSGFAHLPEWDYLRERITEGLPLLEVAQEIDPNLAALLRTPDLVLEKNNKLTACRELRGIIETQEEAAEILGPPGAETCRRGPTPVDMGPRRSALVGRTPPGGGPGRSDRSVRLSCPGEAQPPARYERRRRPDGQAFSTRPEPGVPPLRFTSDGALIVGEVVAVAHGYVLQYEPDRHVRRLTMAVSTTW